MRLSKLVAIAASVTIAAAMAACGSSEKTADKEGSSGPKLIGVTMPTKSSER